MLLNVKDNFITVAYHNRSDSYDYDRQLIKQLVNAHRDLDRHGYKNLCEVDKSRLRKLRGRAEAYFRSVISQVLSDFQKNGVTDIILEELHFSRKVGGGYSAEFGIKFNRLIRMLRLGSIKTWFREQANNRGMKVHFVNPAFSSQECCKCHFVHRNNRDQQKFECIVCGHKEHADSNAAKVIRLRFIEDVIRKSLFEVEKGIVGRQLCGKKISKFAVKKVIDNLCKAA